VRSESRMSDTLAVNQNLQPVINGSDGDLGLKESAFTHEYTATEPNEGGDLTVTESLNNNVLRTFTAESGDNQELDVGDLDFIRSPNGVNNLTVVAENEWGATKTRRLTFTRDESKIDVILANPLSADVMPTRAFLRVSRFIPEGALFQVEICNNAYDEEPDWEDCTEAVINSEIHYFTNKTKAEEDWGVGIRVNVDRNNVTGFVCYVAGISGAFDGETVEGS